MGIVGEVGGSIRGYLPAFGRGRCGGELGHVAHFQPVAVAAGGGEKDGCPSFRWRLRPERAAPGSTSPTRAGKVAGMVQTVALCIHHEHGTLSATLRLADVLPVPIRRFALADYVGALAALGVRLAAETPGPAVAVSSMTQSGRCRSISSISRLNCFVF